MNVAERRRGLRWGRLLAGISAARHGLATAWGERDLLSKETKDALQEAFYIMEGVEQKAWAEEYESIKAKKGKR